MKSLLRSLTLLAIVVAVASPLSADDAKKAAAKEKKAAGNKQGQKKGAGPDLAARTLKQFEKASLTEEQVGKIKDLAKVAQEKSAEARKKARLSKEQQEARTAAMKKAKEEGKTKKDLQDAINAAVELSADQKAAMDEARAIQTSFQKEVRGLLTDEQRKAIRGKGGAKKKPAEGDKKKPAEKKKKKAAE